jgi:glycosyltransferase involved in cell wall biosynthesis
VLISICIPTYNSGEKLTRLLDSIKIQTFIDYEIIVSDDSNNENVKREIENNYADLKIRYFHNAIALGTPNNWNNAVAKAKGDWIKLMHHDDWFTQPNALEIFVNAIRKNERAKLIFCSFNYVDVETKKTTLSACSKLDIFLLKQNYLNLYKNFIGNPSCTLISSKYKPYEYDKTIKWLIDFDFYTEYFQREKEFTYINLPLIAFGVHHSQVTANVQNNPVVEIPESYIFFKKYGIKILRNIFVYDFFWRMYRNLQLKNINQLESYLGTKNKYPAIQHLISTQNMVSRKMIKNGLVSKSLMLFAYLRNRFFS